MFLTSPDEHISADVKNAGPKCAARGSLQIQDVFPHLFERAAITWHFCVTSSSFASVFLPAICHVRQAYTVRMDFRNETAMNNV